jgi:glycosyltransferase involved in cell wall biosynthesis
MPHDLDLEQPRRTTSSHTRSGQSQAAEPSPVQSEEHGAAANDASATVEPESRPLRALIVSHSHPTVSKGGAEIAAFQLFQALTGLEGWEPWFLGCQHDGMAARLGAVFTQPFSAHEYLYAPGDFDWFKFANRDPRFPGQFAELLAELRPDVVHFHHFSRLGVECFRHVRQALPGAAIVLTLHEFLAICNHYGQMVTKGNETLCDEASLARCHACFPEIEEADFFLRKMYIESFFAEVDQFVCPSRFLADRFIAWGIPEARIAVMENVIAHPLACAPAAAEPYEGPLRVGFFGQISRLKGINVLFDAAELLAKANVDDIVFDVHGEYRNQPPEYQKAFLQRLAGVGHNVRYHGPYEPQRVDALMRQVDVTVVPSIWWENSPVVIQEAFRNRRPVVCSDIGGMAEKVRDGLDGWQFSAGSAWSLANVLKRLAAKRELVQAMTATMRRPPDAEATVAAHVELYHRLIAGRAPGGALPPAHMATAGVPSG